MILRTFYVYWVHQLNIVIDIFIILIEKYFSQTIKVFISVVVHLHQNTTCLFSYVEYYWVISIANTNGRVSPYEILVVMGTICFREYCKLSSWNPTQADTICSSASPIWTSVQLVAVILSLEGTRNNSNLTWSVT